MGPDPSLFPLLFVDTPQLVDYPGHIGRYYIALNLDNSPELQQYWDFNWKIIANLGVDLLMMPLGAMLGVERAAWLIALLVAPLMIWGIYRVSVAIHGKAPLSSAVAVIFVMSFPYLMGFMNYWLSVALGLHYFASWVQRDSAGRMTIAIRLFFVVGAILLWLCHAYGWAITVIWIAGYASVKYLADGNWQKVRLWPAICAKILRSLWPVLIPFMLMFLWRSDNQGAQTEGWGNWAEKSLYLGYVLRDQKLWLDLASSGFVFIFLFMAVAAFRSRLNAGLALSSAVFALLYIMLPYRLMGSAYADVRLLPILLMTALMAIKPIMNAASSEARAVRAFACVGVGIIIARMFVATLGGLQYQSAYSSHLAALEKVNKGARILAFTAQRCEGGWRGKRTQHLASLAIARKDAFVNTQWDVPGAQLLTVKFDKNAAFRVDPSQYLHLKTCDTDYYLAAALSKIKANQYDYLWLFGMKPHTVPTAGFTLIYHDNDTALYQINNHILQK